MKLFWKKAGRGYMMVVEPINDCWSYLFSCEWRCTTGDALRAIVMLVQLIIITPFAYLCVAPIVAVLEGMRKEGE